MIVEVSRRALLGSTIAGSALFLAACTKPETIPQPDQDDAVKREVAADEQELISAYTATIQKYPDLEPRLRALRSQHEDHLEAMGVTSAASPSEPLAIPASAEQAVKALSAAERKAAKQRVKSCEAAANADLAWTLALIGASEASHAAFLTKRAAS